MNHPMRSLMLLALVFGGSAHALQQGTTADGRSYASGGVSVEERETLQAQRERFNLWVITAVRKTGAFLSDVRLTIHDAQQKIVFDAPLDGPWLFVDLPPGRYTLEAQFGGQTQQRATTLHAGDHHEALFYFDAEAESSVESAPSAPSAYLGWRLYRAHCSRCHGPDGEGTDSAPDLLARVRGMSEGRFVTTVLQRYQWVVPQAEAAGEGAGRDALVQDVLRRREGPTEMPAWKGEPSVRAHVDDLYRYLDARAHGEVGLERPSRR